MMQHKTRIISFFLSFIFLINSTMPMYFGTAHAEEIEIEAEVIQEDVEEETEEIREDEKLHEEEAIEEGLIIVPDVSDSEISGEAGNVSETESEEEIFPEAGGIGFIPFIFA